MGTDIEIEEIELRIQKSVHTFVVNWFNKGVDTIQCGKNRLLVFFFKENVAGITRYSHAKEWIWTPISHQQKLTKNES